MSPMFALKICKLLPFRKSADTVFLAQQASVARSCTVYPGPETRTPIPGARNPKLDIQKQVFEAMGMFISKESFYKYAMPCMVSIASQLHARS